MEVSFRVSTPRFYMAWKKWFTYLISEPLPQPSDILGGEMMLLRAAIRKHQRFLPSAPSTDQRVCRASPLHQLSAVRREWRAVSSATESASTSRQDGCPTPLPCRTEYDCALALCYPNDKSRLCSKILDPMYKQYVTSNLSLSK